MYAPDDLDDIEIGVHNDDPASLEVKTFQEQIGNAKTLLSEINDLTSTIDTKYSEFLASTKSKKKAKGIFIFVNIYT